MCSTPRGAIGVTERAAYFGKMRDLSKQVAALYIKSREDKGFPLLAKLAPVTEPMLPIFTAGESGPQDFLLEIGVEELPPDELESALQQLRQNVPNLLKELRLEHQGFTIHGTPRRLAVQVSGLADRQPDREVEVKGPPTNRAYDDKGQPNPYPLGLLQIADRSAGGSGSPHRREQKLCSGSPPRTRPGRRGRIGTGTEQADQQPQIPASRCAGIARALPSAARCAGSSACTAAPWFRWALATWSAAAPPGLPGLSIPP